MSNPVFQYTAGNPFGLGNYGITAMVDIDGDNDLDGFVGAYDGTVLFFKNTGTMNIPSFATPITNPFGLIDVGSIANPTFVDIDNDGDQDAFVGNNGGNTRFFRNDGTANNPLFVAAGINPFALRDVGYRAGSAFADIDSDGDLDAFVGNGKYETLFFQNTGTIDNPIFVLSTSAFGLTGYPNFIDVDKDGDLDAFSQLGITTVFYRNIGTVQNPRYYLDGYNPFGLTGGYSSNFADADGDNDLDVFVGGVFFQNIGNGYTPSFDPSPQLSVHIGSAYFAKAIFVDIDGDGDLDAFMYDYDENENSAIHFYENSGTATDPLFANGVVNEFGLEILSTFVDIDGDGDFDAFSRDFSGTVLFSQNTGTVENPAFTAAIANPFGLSKANAFADIDGDGDLDVFFSDYRSNSTQFSQNTGTATNPVYASAVTNPFGLSYAGGGFNFIDIDLDGDLDAISDGFEFFFNTGTVNNPEFSYGGRDLFGILAAYLPHMRYSDLFSPTFVDIDGDGDFDAFVGGYFEGVGLYVNNHAPNAFNLSAAEVYTPNTLLDLNNIVVEDPDSPNVTAILTMSNVDAGSLSTGTSGTVTSIFDVTTGVWSASGTLADVNALLAGIIFTPTFNFSGNFSIDTSVSDGVAAPLLGSKSFTVAVDAMLFSTPGNDNLIGTSSLNDTASYENATAPVTVSLNIVTQQNTLGAGLDTLTNIENLIGSDFSDHLTGNTANNILEGRLGDDVLTGWSGQDTMIGGWGSDSYFVENVGDVVIEEFNQGIDTVNSSITYTLPLNVENLILRGASAINGTGNGQANTITGNASNNLLNGGAGHDILLGNAGKDTLDGGAGRDTLDGGFGADVLKGRSGNDNYVVDSAGDSVIEVAGGGIDAINSSVTYTLPAQVENLSLTGTSAINGTGNTQNNIIIGNAGNNTLNGGNGNDILDGKAGINTLIGGVGNDIFRFTTKSHIDTVTDFNVANDTIQLENAIFTSLTTPGILAASQFRIGTKALDANDYIIYNKTAGKLLYDADGNGAGAAVQIATIGVGLAMTNADIVVI